MSYSKLSQNYISFFINILGNENVIYNQDIKKYSSDHTEDLVYSPEIVLFPRTTKQVSEIVSYCNKNLIPITPSAALTGLSGGALPVFGGVSLSTKKMNKLLEINTKNFQATVEPGLINEDFQNELEGYDLFYPPDPASKGSCTIGGNIALNAGGPRAVKYGVTSNYILNLEVVLPNGNIIWTGANTLKNATGYNLTQLITGSEGTLAVITKAVIRLLPLPKFNVLMLVPFIKINDACKVVSEIFFKGIVPSCLELMEKEGLDLIKKNNICEVPFDINEEAYLLIELDGNNNDQLIKNAENLNEIFDNYNCGKVLFAESSGEKNKLWKVRRNIAIAVKSFSVYKEEDTVVPRDKLPQLMSGVKSIGKKYNFKSICYGHVGDGNLHVNILKENLSEFDWNVVLKKSIREIFELCVQLGGTISGEHGIGLVQKEFIDIPFPKEMINLQKKIKKIFDPNNIMNPGKIFPD
ncbi:MAG: FAD-binding oxidoreductase [Flavobacteriales bacterium]|nr:FAD-binding oxidoreductase [Flavobacteriales bacterium]|tara:strand:- start:6901 stop:8301 length:1401 start_codon:yes stop_codon:yes gene_type:complete